MFLTRLAAVTAILAATTIGCPTIAMASDSLKVMRLMMACPTIKNVQVVDDTVSWMSDDYSLSKDYRCIEEALANIWTNPFPVSGASCLRPKAVFVGNKSKLPC